MVVEVRFIFFAPVLLGILCPCS